MATWTKCYGFVEHLNKGVHNFTTQSTTCALTVALSNTAPASETTPPHTGTAAQCVLANVTQISYTNLSTRVLGAFSTNSQTTGTFTLDAPDLVLTASGAVATFRYAYLYNDTPTSPADPLIATFDYGSAVTLANGETFTFTWNASGLLTLA